MAKTIDLTDATFRQQVIDSDRPVLVDFWAPWCPPCRLLGQVIDSLAEQYESVATVAKVDVDQHRELADRYGVQRLPTVLIFRNGIVVETLLGHQQQQRYAEALDRALE